MFPPVSCLGRGARAERTVAVDVLGPGLGAEDPGVQVAHPLGFFGRRLDVHAVGALLDGAHHGVGVAQPVGAPEVGRASREHLDQREAGVREPLP